MRLRTILALTLSAIVMIPVVVLAIWMEYAAFNKEMREVDQKHRLFAEQMSFQLARYANRVKSYFQAARRLPLHVDRLQGQMSELHIKCFLRFDPAAVQIRDYQCISDGFDYNARVLARNAADMLATSAAPTAEPLFSGVISGPNDLPAMYIYALDADGQLSAALFSTAFIIDTQSSLNFGTSGHAAIVDQNGRALAHPRAEVTLIRKDLSALAPIKQVLTGENGLTQFFSPVKKQQMVSAFVTVPIVGWGVMVNQAVSELEERAAADHVIVLVVVIAGVLFAAAAGWIFSDYMARAILPVVAAAKRNAAGEFGAQIPPTGLILPNELVELRRTFNVMATEIQAAYQQQNEAFELLRMAQSADQAKSIFLANVSHELKTPLNAIMGFTQLIRAGTNGPILQDKYREYIDNIYVSADHLNGLISNLLDLSHAGKPEQPLQPVRNCLRDVVNTAVQMLTPAAAKRQVTLLVNPDVDPEIVLEADRHMLAQMLLNLISNAIKFSPTDADVTVSVRKTVIGDVEINVIDQGCGIAEGDIALALQPFVQLDNGLSREGVGLGLSLVKAMIERHGGTLTITSKIQKGTTATLIFPRVALPVACLTLPRKVCAWTNSIFWCATFAISSGPVRLRLPFRFGVTTLYQAPQGFHQS